MSENNNIQNEEALWDLLSSEPVAESKSAKSEPKFAKPRAEKPAPAPKPRNEKDEPPKPARKLDGFFYGCMAGVAAVSVAATLFVSSMLGGDPATPAVKDPVSGNLGSAVTETQTDALAALELENAELRAQLELQKEQIKDLQNDLMTLMGSEEYLSTVSTDPNESNEVLDAQVKAMETLAQIQEAYADFDRARLEELIPEMDKQLSYLTPEALNNYYLILEYVEQPSNG